MQFIYGSKFLRNSFFSNLASTTKIRLLEECTQRKVKAGEFVYHKGQMADNLYLIIEGRAACRLTRNISFKSFIEGSYFGDLELLTRQKRLFSVQATDDLRLAVIEREKLAQIMANDPVLSSTIIYKTLKRYINIKASIRKIMPYQMITMNTTMIHDYQIHPIQTSVDIAAIDRLL